MALSLKQVTDVCFNGGGADQCRYLDEEIDDNGDVIFLCKKKSPDKKIIDEELVDHLNEMKRLGLDPLQQTDPLADHCSGYVVLRTKQQGYDIP